MHRCITALLLTLGATALPLDRGRSRTGEPRDDAGIDMRNCRHADWQMWHFREV
ncbi:hypothetical protein ACFY2W_21060 [Streptomyces sp. NPDC001262]|uniref:hypothetical protein n=1 Tax=Streptomyces sp. NPDC001262 TaxID=3364552 RepID=UPI003693E13C